MSLPRVILTSTDGAEAVLIPGGDFYFGIDQQRVAELIAQLKEVDDPIFKTELPRRLVTVRNCYIDKYPVTNRQYTAFMMATRHPAPLFINDRSWNLPDQPVGGISYRDAEAYARWARKRIPTEEEWERAARGTDERVWPWGNEFDPKRCNSRGRNLNRTTAVDSFANGISPVGAFDMAGNVWELTSGNWENFGKTIRGGSYKNSAAYCRCTCRWGLDPDIKGSTWLGFRCIMDLAAARIYGKVVA